MCLGGFCGSSYFYPHSSLTFCLLGFSDSYFPTFQTRKAKSNLTWYCHELQQIKSFWQWNLVCSSSWSSLKFKIPVNAGLASSVAFLLGFQVASYLLVAPSLHLSVPLCALVSACVPIFSLQTYWSEGCNIHSNDLMLVCEHFFQCSVSKHSHNLRYWSSVST